MSCGGLAGGTYNSAGSVCRPSHSLPLSGALASGDGVMGAWFCHQHSVTSSGHLTNSSLDFYLCKWKLILSSVIFYIFFYPNTVPLKHSSRIKAQPLPRPGSNSMRAPVKTTENFDRERESMLTPESLPRGGYPNALASVEPQAPSQLTHTQTTSTGGAAHSTLATGRPQKIVAELMSATCAH